MAFGTQQDFGVDISAYPDLDPSFSGMTGNRVIEEMAIRRLTTEGGSVVDDQDFGKDLREYLNVGSAGFNGAADQSELYKMKSDIERELVKDQRILSCSAVCTYIQNATALLPANSIHAVITINPGVNPFTLELSVTKVSVALLKTG